ncbi:hypothetical protein K525DRAFT_272268 [Schizophyllum commune Loenen D]|nr:hypothetical protein K525DRAFT_272268 [Schizophyllum commune Loenen D]
MPRPSGSPMQYLPRKPNATAYGPLNDYLGIIPRPRDACKCFNVLTSRPNATAIGLLNDVLESSASTPLAPTMRSKRINVLSSWPNATDSPNGAVIGQRNDLVDV